MGLENTKEKSSELWWRDKYLQLTLIALRNYQQTNNKQAYDYFKYFGQEAKHCDRRIKKLSEKTNQGKQNEIGILPRPIETDEIDLPW